MDFQEWLLARGLSASTAKKYVGALNGSLSKWGIDHKITDSFLGDIRDPSKFTTLSGLIKATDIFAERNSRGNHMYGATLANYSRYLNDRSRIVASKTIPLSPFHSELAHIQLAEEKELPFEPNGENDARVRVLREVIRRQGQPKFRSNLLTAYDSRCAISKCSLLVVLDAAHVTPYLGPYTNSISNGILLRTDLHALWDQGLVAIDPSTGKISISDSLKDSEYQQFDKSQPFQPVDLGSRISPQALAEQWKIFQKDPRA